MAKKIPFLRKLKYFGFSVIATCSGILFLIVFLTYTGLFGPVPGTDELQQVNRQQHTIFYSSDGKQIGTTRKQNSIHTELEDVSPVMVDALLSIEDVRFYDHNGIDNRALARVLVKTILLGQDSGGGSTLTQQLAKNLYPREYSHGFFLITDKIREMIIASRMEAIFSKEEILTLYLNKVSFGEDTFGIEMASRRFFNTSASDLTLRQAAVLAGLLKATTSYNPYRNPESSKERRDVVLRQMEKYGMISTEEAEAAIEQPLVTDYTRYREPDDIAPYFLEMARRELTEILSAHSGSKNSSYNASSDGLEVVTTLDTRIQQAADAAISERMKYLQSILDRETGRSPIFGMDDPDILQAWKQTGQYRELVSQGLTDQEIEDILHTPVNTSLFTWDGYRDVRISPYEELKHYLTFLNAGFVALHPYSGRVMAWTGGINHRHFPYDQVTAHRQPGSAFKPILYAAALENGRKPCDYQRNVLAQYADYDGWTPRNHEEEYGGRYSLQGALSQSINTVAVHVAMETGVENIQQTASAMGIRSPMPEAPSIALGTAEVSLLELTAAYTSFLNSGQPSKPVFIQEIRNSDGERIYFLDDSLNTSAEIVSRESDISGITPETAGAMVQMLQKAVNEGTGEPLRSEFGIRHALAGKTGTTQQFTDGWFVGFTPDLVFGTRIGGWNNRVRFREFPAYASQTALPVVGGFLNRLSENPELNAAENRFPLNVTNTSFTLSCPDFQNDRLRDRILDFFTGRDSDDPRIIEGEEQNSDSTKKKGGFFRRLGRALGIQ
ncbi:transglycosylase domain-containing protein [Rhodohalobacter mucosus]|uniref:Penicillin-binding protein n=1 Tax=Rhodohalobacter mucosus TaxID=2079485 RepID=A0A316U1M9_9BACT|nr:transglycosylase domain-containing protein [Rhodohalobacter mucosus]PWN06896.1 penicillin-binding protein [Rhodohalobacter mucosus]